jgi:D-alanyl-D-alanine dipeptidase
MINSFYASMTLVELPNIKSSLLLYTGENIFGLKLYSTNRVMIHRDLVEPLNRVQQQLQGKGYQLFLVDAYRPLSVQRQIFDLIKDPKYVADPTMSRHPRGTAVDVGLADLDGTVLSMQSHFSDFSPASAAAAPVGSPILERREALQTAFLDNGFEIYDPEWWHFDFAGWQTYPALDEPL